MELDGCQATESYETVGGSGGKCGDDGTAKHRPAATVSTTARAPTAPPVPYRNIGRKASLYHNALIYDSFLSRYLKLHYYNFQRNNYIIVYHRYHIQCVFQCILFNKQDGISNAARYAAD